MTTSTVSIKLLTDTKSQKVLFAEAGKDFVDFLFNLMALPVGTVTRLLTKDSMVGSLGNLYHSIEDISETYLIQKEQIIEALLKPKSSSSSVLLLPLLHEKASVSRKFYFCKGKIVYNLTFGGVYFEKKEEHPYVADDPDTTCPTCYQEMSQELTYVAQSKSQVTTSGYKSDECEEGFVKGVVTYMIMDDLVVKPMSNFSTITMLNSLDVKEIGALQEKVVHLDIAQVVELLKASLQSKTVLTSVFLRCSDA